MRARPLLSRMWFRALIALLPAAAAAAPVAPGDVWSGNAATVVLIGEAPAAADLVTLLEELLGRQKVRVRFLREPQFDPSHLLSGETSDPAVWVFVELRGPRAARLYFRGPHAARFLLRDLPLRDGLDEVGRESIGQVVESSVVALQNFTAGISREEALTRLGSERGLEPTVTAAPSGGPRPFSRAFWLAARYSGVWSGSALKAAHGPEIEIGIEWRGVLLLRPRLSAAWWFEQQLATPEVEAVARSLPLRCSIDVGWPVGRTQAWVVGIGAGVDFARTEPRRAAAPGVTLSPPATRLLPVARAELRYELGRDAWRIGAAAFADASLLDTHYDIVYAGVAERAATPWSVRPGAALMFAWRPAWDAP
jgi:hypothetical protein